MAKHQTITATEARFPLANLALSPLNPRQEVPQAEVEELAESIWEAGLIQSIAGIIGKDGLTEIVAGGRRLRALKFLAEKHSDLATIRPELANPLVMLAPDEATARTWAGLENIARRDLNPADEIRAYGKMEKAGSDPSTIARAFAVTEKHVYRRLALSALPVPVLDALAAGEISLSNAAAFTVCKDEALALEVLDQCRGDNWSDYHLRNALTRAAAKTSDRRVKFIGLDAYTAAGGTVSGDLFRDEDETYLDDTKLLDRLFSEQLDAKAQTLAGAGWKWVTARVDLAHFGWTERETLGAVQLQRIPGSVPDEKIARYDELHDQAEAETIDAEGQAELDAMNDLLKPRFTDAQKAVSGVVALVDYNGRLQFVEGLVRLEDQEQAVEAGVLSEKEPVTQAEEKPKSPISNALADDLHRATTGARQHAALRDPDLLLSLLAYQLTGQMGYRAAFGLRKETVSNMPTTGEAGYALDPRLTEPGDDVSDPWNADLAKSFAAFRAKGTEHVMAELTRHLAGLLTGADGTLRDLITKEAKVDTREVWTPTAANFWTRVPGSYRLAVWRDLLDLREDHPTATTFAKMKKAEQAERLESLFTDAGFRKAQNVTKAQAARIAKWLPEGMA